MSIILLSVSVCLVTLETGLRFFGRGFDAEQERNNEIREADSSALRIVTIGDSMSADRGRQVPWPRILEGKLLERGIQARVYNLARLGTWTGKIVQRLPDELEKFKPHIVINMSGGSDTTGLTEQDEPWWSDLRTVKFVRWLTFTQKVPPKELIGHNYCNPEVTEKINSGLRSSDAKFALALLDKEVESFDSTRKAQNYRHFALALPERSGFEEIYVDLARRSLDAEFQGGPLLRRFVRYLPLIGREEECLPVAKKMLELNWDISDDLIGAVTSCAHMSMNKGTLGSHEWPGVMLDLVGNINPRRPTHEETVRNHRKMHTIIAEKGITHVEMQYPGLSVESLKEFYHADKSNELASEFRDIIFIENKENFEEALRKYKYEELFEDKAGGAYGHTTTLGTSILAENVVLAVLDIIETRPKTGAL